MRILIATETYPPNVNGAAIATARIAKMLARRGHKITVVMPSATKKRNKVQDENLTVYGLESVLFNKAQGLHTSPKPLNSADISKIVKEAEPDIIHIATPGTPISQTTIRIARKMQIPVIGASHITAQNLLPYLPDVFDKEVIRYFPDFVNMVNPRLQVSHRAMRIAQKMHGPINARRQIAAENFFQNIKLPDQIEKVLSNGVWKMYVKWYSMLDLIITPTPAAADMLRKLKIKTNIEVISNGIDLNKFKPDNDGEYLKKRLKLPKNNVILFLGRLDKEKNVDVLIKAVKILKDTFDFHLVIVGKGTKEASLKNLAKELGVLDRIIFTGHLPKKDLPNIYKIADFFVMPGISELQSLVTMEAMASGLPVIGANAVALPHLIKNGKNGFLFKPGDEQDLAKKIKMLLESPEKRRKMGKYSHKLIKKHDINEVIKRTEKIYAHVIKIHPATLSSRNSKRNVIKRLKTINIRKFIPHELRA
jgi:1,2-diacylglycerol 3-alpha-glucosyltransferase